MTIAFGAIGSRIGSSATTTAIDYPASPGAGDLAIVCRNGWNSSQAAFTDESGWTNQGERAGGTGTSSDNHSCRIHADTKQLAGGESGSVTFDMSTNAGMIGVMARYTKGSGETWSIAYADADDNTHGADRSATSGTISLQSGDMLVALVAVDTDAALTITSPTFTASGITFGTVNQRTPAAGAGVNNGNDGNIEIFDAAVSAGSGTVAVTFAMTTATSQCGPVILLRLREITVTGTASIDLSGAGSAAAAGDATASLSLSGSGTHSSAGTGVLSLSASGNTLSGSASLSLSGSADVAAGASASGSLTLSGTASTEAPASASGSLTLSGAGDLSGILAASGSASLDLDGSLTATTSMDATANLSLAGSGDATGPGSGTASVTLSASGVASLAASGSASLALSGVGTASLARTGTASLSLTGAASMPTPRSGTAALTLLFRTTTVVMGGVVTAQGVGRVTIVDATVETSVAMRITVLDPVVERAPTSITVVLSGAQAQTDVTFDIDGTDVYTVSADSNGMLGPTSLNLTATLGTAGTHTVTATQVTDAGTITDSADFEVLRAPALYPQVIGPDAAPVLVAAALTNENGIEVRHWVLQDLLAEVDGGIGSYVFPHNPSTMTSPHLEHALSSRHSTASDGKAHIFEGGRFVKEWTFGGFCPSQEHQEAIEAYRDLNRRFWAIDHRNRAWKVIFTNAEFEPRLRQNVNGVDTDWGSDFTVTATVFDQAYSTPEEA